MPAVVHEKQLEETPTKMHKISLERPLQLKPRYHLLIYEEVERVQSPELTHRRLSWNKRDHSRGAEQSDAFCHRE